MTKLILNRRTLLGTGAAALAAPAYLRRAHAQGGTVNIWTYADFIPAGFIDRYREETGTEINVRLVDDQGKQFNLLAAEAPEPTADLVTVAGHRYLQFIAGELLAPLDTSQLSNWGTINPVYSESDWATVEGSQWGAPILSGMEVLAYNTDFVSPEQATSWQAMFSDEFAGRIAYTIQDMMSLVMLKQGHDGNMIEYMDDPERAAEVVAQARDFLIDNKDKVRKFYDSGAEVQQMFVNQDIVMAAAWNGPIAALMADGFPVDMTIPEEGSYGFVYTLNVTNNAPNPDAAYSLLDALLASPEIGAEMSRGSGFISTYAGAEEHLTDAERQAAAFTEEELGRLRFFRAEANDMKYDLVDPAVEQIKAA